MKVVYLLLISFAFHNIILASISFSVSEVDENTKKHPLTENLSEEDLARWTIKGQSLSLENFQTNYPLTEDLNGKNDRIKNAFVATIFTAYSNHYPLELSVEDFWVTIAQGIGIHLNENSEKYRQVMVSHEGKKELNLSVDALRLPDSMRPKYGDKSIPAVNWSAAVHLMGDQIKADMKTDLATLLTSPFSNTTAIEQAVFDCTLMDTVKSYYSYKFVFLCGLPKVTLRGTPDDFQQIIDRVNELRSIFTDFHWWLDSILPHLRKLKASAKGKPDIDWWQKICHHVGGSGIDDLSRWLADFIPYKSDGKGHYLKTRSSDQTKDTFASINLGDFIESIGQNHDTGALRPSLGWVTAVKQQNNHKNEL